ncbi:MAG TPA: HAMP domain-containing sensor histidine kinase [Bacteroidales bacterium]
MVSLVKSDIGQDIVSSQLLQAQRRIEILKHIGFEDLQLTSATLASKQKDYCISPMNFPIRVDNTEVGMISDCPKAKTIIRFLFSSNIFTTGICAIILMIGFSITLPLYQYRKSIRSFISESTERGYAMLYDTEPSDAVVAEIQAVFKSMHIAKSKIDQLEFENKKSKALTQLARQVAHDIRSPLSALNIASSILKNITEEEKALIKNATCRINEIANDLLKEKSSSKFYGESSGGESVSEVLMNIVSEKRHQYINRSEVKIEAQVEGNPLAPCSINNSELKRVLSNLINNSVEAIKASGTVSVNLKTFESMYQLTISDDGVGIPKDILNKVGLEGFSFGKSNSESGSGLGVSSVKKLVESKGGNFLIQSKEGIGTMITLNMPFAQA